MRAAAKKDSVSVGDFTYEGLKEIHPEKKLKLAQGQKRVRVTRPVTLMDVICNESDLETAMQLASDTGATATIVH